MSVFIAFDEAIYLLSGFMFVSLLPNVILPITIYFMTEIQSIDCKNIRI